MSAVAGLSGGVALQLCASFLLSAARAATHQGRCASKARAGHHRRVAPWEPKEQEVMQLRRMCQPTVGQEVRRSMREI